MLDLQGLTELYYSMQICAVQVVQCWLVISLIAKEPPRSSKALSTDVIHKKLRDLYKKEIQLRNILQRGQKCQKKFFTTEN